MEIPKELESEIQILLSKGKKVEAVKLVKDAMNCGLKDAKDFVDGFGRVGVKPLDIIPADMEAELLSFIRQGRKIDAVKLYKDKTGAGLEECVNYINSLIDKQPLMNSGPAVKSRETQLADIVKQQELKPKSGCFIATACYGDYAAPEVLVLRVFRDEQLMTSVLGSAFVRLYYAVSPFLARQLDRSERGKYLVRTYLLNGIVRKLSKKDK
jgi:ribosomal protein L7/L12